MWPFEIAARDGLSLVSYLSLPPAADPDGDGKAARRCRWCCSSTADPGSAIAGGFDPVHQMLANRGYAVLSVNFRGSTGFGKNFLNAGNLQWGRRCTMICSTRSPGRSKSGVTMKDKVASSAVATAATPPSSASTFTPDVFACGVDIVGMSNLLTLIAVDPAVLGSAQASILLARRQPDDRGRARL